MNWFRQTLRNHRVIILTVLAINIFYMTEGTRFVYAYQVYEQKEARLKEISEFLDIPVERLRPDHEGLFDSIRKLFVDEVDPRSDVSVKAAGLKRLREVLRKHEEQVASAAVRGSPLAPSPGREEGPLRGSLGGWSEAGSPCADEAHRLASARRGGQKRRANNLDCTTLEQLKKAPSVIREDFPILPGTLRGKILQIDGEAMAIPDAFQQKIHMEVRRAGSGALLAWESFLPALYGHRIEIVYQGATAFST